MPDRMEKLGKSPSFWMRTSEDLWLKSCGAYAIGKLGLSSLEKELDSFLSHPDPLLSETARQAKLRLASLSEATTA